MSLWRVGPCGVPLLMAPLLLPDKQSSSASLETLLALLQAEGAKIEEDTEVKPGKAPGPPGMLCTAARGQEAAPPGCAGCTGAHGWWGGARGTQPAQHARPEHPQATGTGVRVDGGGRLGRAAGGLPRLWSSERRAWVGVQVEAQVEAR